MRTIMLHCASVCIRKLPPRQIIHNYIEFGRLHGSMEMINSSKTGSKKYVNDHIKMRNWKSSHNYSQRNLAQIPKVAVHLWLRPQSIL